MNTLTDCEQQIITIKIDNNKKKAQKIENQRNKCQNTLLVPKI